MKKIRSKILLFRIFSVLIFLCSCTVVEQDESRGIFKIGWSSIDITPEGPALIRNRWDSEGVADPILATALAMELGRGNSSEKAIIISCDLGNIPDGRRSSDNLLDRVREILTELLPELLPEQVLLNATHTHTAPRVSELTIKDYLGVDLDVIEPEEYMDFLSGRIARAAEEAWHNRKAGGISYGLGHAVVSHNRIQVDMSGKSQMYGNTNRSEFSHIEGYEDHSVNLLYTWDSKNILTGVIINIASPSQVSENSYKISADFWHDTREELGKRLGKDVYILSQLSAAGDQSPHIMVGAKAEERMQRIMFPGIDAGRNSMGRRKQIAVRISDAVTSVLPYMKDNVNRNPVFFHNIDTIELSRRLVTFDDGNNAIKESERWEKQYEKLKQEIEDNPLIKSSTRWYSNVCSAYRNSMWANSLTERYESQQMHPKYAVELHVMRIDDIVIATNPFELYLDYGIRIKARSPAVQTFLVQLTGSGSYLPVSRSVDGGAYGAIVRTNLVGPEGGQELVEKTLEMINAVWHRE